MLPVVHRIVCHGSHCGANIAWSYRVGCAHKRHGRKPMQAACLLALPTESPPLGPRCASMVHACAARVDARACMQRARCSVQHSVASHRDWRRFRRARNIHVSVVQHTMQHCSVRQRREAERRSMRQRAALNVDVPPYWLEQLPRPDYVVRTKAVVAHSALSFAYLAQRHSSTHSVYGFQEVELECTSEEFRLYSRLISPLVSGPTWAYSL